MAMHGLVLVQCLTGMEISEFTNISFEHPKDSAFKKYRSQDLAPVRFTNPNFNYRVQQQRALEALYLVICQSLS